jgi:hypothetical protein
MKMKPGDVVVIKDTVKMFPDLFIECCKNYMREHSSTYQEGLSFANGYAELRKYDLVWKNKAQSSGRRVQGDYKFVTAGLPEGAMIIKTRKLLVK